MFDASALARVAFRPGNVPDPAVRHAFPTEGIAASEPLTAELPDAQHRPGLPRLAGADLRADLLGQLGALSVAGVPAVAVADCRGPRGNKRLKLALAAGAAAIVGSGDDLPVLHPWRGTCILRPASYRAEAEGHR